jgi:hypothetical protein
LNSHGLGWPSKFSAKHVPEKMAERIIRVIPHGVRRAMESIGHSLTTCDRGTGIAIARAPSRTLYETKCVDGNGDRVRDHSCGRGAEWKYDDRK